MNELEIDELQPLLTTRAPQPPEQNKLIRWNRLSIQVCKQCLRTQPLKILGIKNLTELLSTTQIDNKLIIWGAIPEEKSNIHSIPLLEALAKITKPPSEALLFIGPEGDFTTEEKSLLQKVGGIPVLLSQQRLRVETAALVMASSVVLAFKKITDIITK